MNLQVSGILETLDGDISFDLGQSGELRGELIARGAGHDVKLASDGRLTIKGSIQADDEVVLAGGTDPVSVDIQATAVIRSVAAGMPVPIRSAVIRSDRSRVREKGSGTKSRNGPSGASHFWVLTPFSSAAANPKSQP